MGLSVKNKTDGTNKRAQTEIRTATVPYAKERWHVHNPGIFLNNAPYCHGCENDDTERANFKLQLSIVNGTSAGQGTWRCGLPAKFIDREQISVQELMALKRMPHKTLNGHLHNQ